MKQFSYGMRSIFEGFFKNRKSEKNLKTYIPVQCPRTADNILSPWRRLLPVSYLESKLISEVSSQVLRRLTGQTSAISTLRLLLTGSRSRGEYLRVVGIHNDG